MFALLEHRTIPGAAGGPVHWDLLVELPGHEGLATWRLALNPLEAHGPIAAQRIGEHRRRYLDYEGDIGGGRGSVRRLDRGEALVLRQDEGSLLLELRGSLLHGVFELTAGPEGAPGQFRPAAS